MRGFRRRLAAGRQVVALLAAVAGLAAAGAVPAAQASITPTSSCAWHWLSLLNGWQSEQSTWHTGDPAFCVEGGVTYLSGSLAQPSTGSDEFAQLPAWAAPASYVYLSVYTKAGIGGVVLITPGGLMYAYDGNATLFTSLAGQSFPAAQSAPPATPIAPLAGLWQSAQGLYDTGDPGYFVSNGIVHLTGSVTSAVNIGSYIGLVSPPDNCVQASVYTLDGAEGDMWIDTAASSGMVDVMDTRADLSQGSGDNASTFTSLVGVAYPAAGAAWQPLPLVNGWSNVLPACDDAGNQPALYSVIGGVVYLSGNIKQSPGGNCEFGVLPAPIRPAHTLYFTTSADGYGDADVQINPDGSTCVWSNGPGNGGSSRTLASLSDISYQLSS